MVTFSAFNDRLPDPTFSVNDAGVVDATGTKGPGFLSTKVLSSEDTQVSRTISGRGIHRTNAAQHWELSIRYNPLTRDQFDVIDAFLQGRKGRRKPFFVVLPQYSKPKDAVFATFATSNIITASLSTAAGSDKITMGGSSTPFAYPKPGDFFTINDSNDINHLKSYKVTRVETPAYYQVGTTAPALNTFRIWVNPPIQKFTTSGATINWINPKFRVMQKGDTLENETDTEGLFQFSLELEEIQP